MGSQQNKNMGTAGSVNTADFGPNISFENYDDAAAAATAASAPKGGDQNGGVPFNVINAVNANGIVSGRKLVDEEWKKLAICAGILAGGCLIGIVVVIILMHSLTATIGKLRIELAESEAGATSVYNALGVKSRDEALAQLNKTDVLSGADLTQIHRLLVDNYGSDYVIDFEDDTVNQVRKGSIYTTVSFGIVREQGTVRAILYTKNADGRWKKAGFDRTADDACANSSLEDKMVLRTIGLCRDLSEAEEQALHPEEEKPTENGGSFDVGGGQTEEQENGQSTEAGTEAGLSESERVDAGQLQNNEVGK